MVNKLFKEYRGELIYFFSAYFKPFIGLFSALIATAFLDPLEMGQIQKILLIPPYLAMLHFGVFNGLNRNISFYKAQGNHEKVQNLVNTSWYIAKIVSFIGLLIASLYSLYFWSAQVSLCSKVAHVILIFSLVFTPLVLHIDTTFRSSQDFGKLGIINVKEGLGLAVFSFMPVALGWIGKVIYECVKPCLAFLLRWRKQPIKVTGKGDVESARNLLSVGFPLIVSGYLYTIFTITDQSIISVSLGDNALGLYNISRIVLITIPLVPIAISTILYPRMSAQYAISKSNKGLRKMFWKALGINIAFLTPICVLFYLALDPIVTYFLPQYIGGIAAAKVNILTCFSFIFLGPSVIMGVVRKNLIYIIILSIAIITMWVLYYSGSIGFNLVDIARTRLYISSILCIAVLFYTYYLTSIDSFIE